MTTPTNQRRTLDAEVKYFGGPNSFDAELWVEGEKFAEAHIDGDVMEAMQNHLGKTEEEIARDIEDALYGALSSEKDRIEIQDLEKVDEDSLRFKGAYTYRRRRSIAGGYVFYDVESGDVGPEEVPSVVKNKMRTVVHRELVGQEGAASELIDIVESDGEGTNGD